MIELSPAQTGLSAVNVEVGAGVTITSTEVSEEMHPFSSTINVILYVPSDDQLIL